MNLDMSVLIDQDPSDYSFTRSLSLQILVYSICFLSTVGPGIVTGLSVGLSPESFGTEKM